MNHKDKAKSLVNQFNKATDYDHDYGKRCALLSVVNIIDSLFNYDDNTESYLKSELGIKYMSCEVQNMDRDINYWESVRKEIEKL